MEILSQLAAIAFVFTLLGACIYLLRRRNAPGAAFRDFAAGSPMLHLLESVRLTPQHAVHRLRFGDEFILVATHSAGITYLASSELDPKELSLQ